jgi:uncharacterized protein (TIGR02996 family)
MSEIPAALLAAICASPDDDLPCLAAADWLEEHGEDDRAELIRAQCELARLQAQDCESQALFEYFQERLDDHLNKVDWKPIDPGLARRWELSQRVLALVKQHGKAWSAAAPRQCGISWIWDRHRPWLPPASWDEWRDFASTTGRPASCGPLVPTLRRRTLPACPPARPGATWMTSRAR